MNDQLGLDESLERFYSTYKESEQLEFDTNLNKFAKLNANTFGSETRARSIDHLVNGYENRAELNGDEIIEFLLANQNVLDLDSSSSDVRICLFFGLNEFLI